MTEQPYVETLIEKLETATKGSRDLDMEITVLAYPTMSFSVEPSDPPRVMATTSMGMVTHVHIGNYTTSVNDAMTLIPHGWGFKADCGLGYGNTFTVGHIGKNKFYDRPEGWGKAATPELALCIAALRARQIADTTSPHTVDGDRPREKNTDNSKSDIE